MCQSASSDVHPGIAPHKGEVDHDRESSRCRQSSHYCDPTAVAAKSAFLGQFVSAAYRMYDTQPSNPVPWPPPPLPGGYIMVAWVQMEDFFIGESSPTFYGLLARNPANVNDFVLAIRGTSDWEEWWDDFKSGMSQVLMPNFGSNTAYVGEGFYLIYKTLWVVPLAAGLGARQAPSKSFGVAGSFADQVAAAVKDHVAASVPPGTPHPEALGANASVTVVGHSLGSALATLYVAENSITKAVQTPLLCTLASPRVGNPNFASTFDALGIPSWRIVNYHNFAFHDVVPDLPSDDLPPFDSWQHVQTEYQFDSYSWTHISLECYHSIYTYLHGLDPTLPPNQWPSEQSWWQNCYYSSTLRSAALRARQRRAAAAALAAPAQKEIAVAAPAGTTINITIKVG